MAISQNFPDVRPSLNLNFARSKTLDPRITFERASIGTYVDENGLIKTASADEARFDHDPVTGESLGLLIEESRSNLITQSSTNWVNNIFEFTNVDNQHVAPDGTTTASDISETTASSQHYATTQGFSITSGSTYTFSFFAKNIDRSSTSITITTGGGFTYTVVKYFVDDINATQVLANSSNAIHTKENYGNGWYRFSLSLTATSTITSAFYVDFRSLNGGVGSTTSMAVWGFQMELGSFPTSYIPTSGSQVTRQGDVAQITGSNLLNFINKDEYTLLCSIKHRQFIVGSYPSIGFGGGSVDNWQQLRFYRADGGNPRADFSGRNSGDFFATGVVILASGSTNPTTPIYNLNEDMLYAFSINSTSAQLDLKQDGFAHQTRSVTFSEKNWFTPNLFAIHYGPTYGISASSNLNGTIKYIKYYPERLTNTQLQNLTK